MKKIKTLKYSALALSILGSSAVMAKPSIKGLTSNQSSEKVQNDIPDRRIPSELNTHSLGVGLGQTFLHGDFNNLGNNEITVDMFYNYAATHSFDFLANFHYSKQKNEGKYSRNMGLTGSIKAKVYQFDSFSPYLLGGLGFYMPKVKRTVGGVLESSESKLTFGYNLGGGLELKLNNKVSVGAMVQYHSPFDVEQDYAAKVSGSYTKLMMTLFYTL